MRKMCILTHGMFANGIQQTCEIFLGKDQPFYAISAYVDENIQPQKQIEEFMATVNPEDQLLFLTDILGGSVHTLVMPYLANRPNTFIIAGVNFPMLLEISAMQDNATIDDYKQIVENAKQSMILMNDFDMTQFQSENDE